MLRSRAFFLFQIFRLQSLSTFLYAAFLISRPVLFHSLHARFFIGIVWRTSASNHLGSSVRLFFFIGTCLSTTNSSDFFSRHQDSLTIVPAISAFQSLCITRCISSVFARQTLVRSESDLIQNKMRGLFREVRVARSRWIWGQSKIS